MTALEFLTAVVADNEGIVSRSEPPPEPPSDGDRLTPVPRRYILIVEDDADIRQVVSDVLEDAGYVVKTATNGVEALRILDIEYMTSQYITGTANKPSLILLDIMLPVMDGPAFYAELRRSRPMFEDVPVIVMSADVNITAFMSWAINTDGLDEPRDKLSKPIGLDLLLQKVRAAAGPP